MDESDVVVLSGDTTRALGHALKQAAWLVKLSHNDVVAGTVNDRTAERLVDVMGFMRSVGKHLSTTGNQNATSEADR